MTGWTVGPWELEVYVSSSGWRGAEQSIAIHSGNTLIATYVTNYCEYPESNDENEANARLIAAAPDLYEALEEALAWMETFDADARLPDFAPIAKARAALSRVKG